MDRLTTQIEDYQELRKQFGPHLEGAALSGMILAASIERAADRIAKSVDNLELIIKTKKPFGL